MRVVADIAPLTFERAQDLVRKGRYTSIAQVITVALENQLVLEEAPDLPSDNGRSGATAGGQASAAADSRNAAPEWVQFVRHPVADVVAAPVPSRSGPFGQNWLWGVNRLGPLKLGVRVLAKILARDGSVRLEAYLEEAGRVAMVLGSWLAGMDDATGRHRGARLSAGFPLGRFGSDEASRGRYVDLFLACLRRKDRRVDGALPALRFVAVAQTDGPPTVGITEAGLRFAQLWSPLIDSDAPACSLSDEERAFYLEHVHQSVPDEVAALLAVARAVGGGATTVEAIDESLRAVHPEWAEKATASLRGTVLGRLTELGLVSRSIRGVSTSYGLTTAGQAFLEREERTR